MNKEVYKDYFFDANGYDIQDGGYKELEEPKTPAVPLAVPELLKPDRETQTDIYYTVCAQTGETEILPGEKTKTWGYNRSILGQTVVFPVGKHIHVTLQNRLPEITTFHWHGLNVSGPYVDGGCHAPVYPGEDSEIDFTLNQPASTNWLHAHPCPATAEQVYKGLATMVVVTDQHEASLSLPRTYGVDDIPVILQDRTFHENNQLDYRTDYDPDGVLGVTPLVNGTVNGYFDVTAKKMRLRLLNGANRREWRLHFSDDLEFVQIAGDGSLLPKPVHFTKLMLTCAERAELVVDFSKYKPGDEVILYSDQTPIMTFRIKEFTNDQHVEVPDELLKIEVPAVDPETPVRKVVMSGMDESVMMDHKKFKMDRIDAEQEVGLVQYWDVSNTNGRKMGMVHPFHCHGMSFLVISRNGHDPYPNERGFKDTVGVNPSETVRILVRFDLAGLYMYHCHILEHEDGGMMAQIETFIPGKPRPHYELMTMDKLMKAFSEERGIPEDELWLPGMDSYHKMHMDM
ncbi:multicopper oxidase family protein [Xylocopilactobacillus apicola]|uniref:Multicopper oxidase n=1 Tax=Xylocopilactobacillus apicola TaxID=2932184 RepID=A0AAU9DUW3_9LACO|nr:multicopper oxidase domain-containing protein [Xylocopilactobacillus apicola]BDR59318.1 multicopper oxidase [Xylocopilactobacillus apicola]